MQKYFRELADDLEFKFKELSSIHDLPRFYMSEYFYELRNQYDIDAESVLLELDNKYSPEEVEASYEEADRVNDQRSTIIHILMQMEEDMLKQLPTRRADSDQVYADLRQRIDQFRKSLDNDEGATSIKELEELYVSIAEEMFNLSSQLEAQIFGNQSIVYLNKRKKPGQLFYVEYGHLNKVEEEALRSLNLESYELNMKEIHEAIVKARNNSMKVKSRRPLIVTRSMLIIDLMKLGERFCEESLICFGKPPRSMEAARDSNKIFNYQGSPLCKLSCMGVEGFEESDRIFDGFKCDKPNLSHSRLTRLGPQLSPLFKKPDSIVIDGNRLECFDENLFKSCTSLRELEMLKSCSPDAKFSLEFLAPLTQLALLSITVPEGPADFGVLKHLRLLTTLSLEGVSSIDATKKRTKLSHDSFLQLFELPALESLDLAHFEIPSLDQDTLAGFVKLRTLRLPYNMISRIHVDALTNCPSRLRTLDLSGNQIVDLQPGLFAMQQQVVNLNLSRNSLRTLTPECFSGLEQLQRLYLNQNHIAELPVGVFRGLDKLLSLQLSHNNLRTIKSGVLDELVHLRDHLLLDDNPIETIEAGSFRHLASLNQLDLKSCRLKSVNDRMFTGLANLSRLDLSGNQISSFEIVTEGEIIRLEKAKLSPSELDAVRDSLFKDLPNLKSLSLGGNRLEKLDLNVFGNLGKLKHLDLSSNKISELNNSSMIHNLALLTHLNLQGNQLSAISKDAFSSAVNLENLNMSKNKLKYLDRGFFRTFLHLETLNLENNNLKLNITRHTFSLNGSQLARVFLASNDLVKIEDGVLQTLPFISRLTMDLPGSFAITTIPSKAAPPLPTHDMIPRFSSISLNKSALNTLKNFFLVNKSALNYSTETLESLSITNSSLVTLDGLDVASQFTSLRHLSLSDNQLTELKASWVEGLVNLTSLDVSRNCLEQLDDLDLFKQLSKLTDINLSHNKLTHINRRLFDDLIHLISIDLSGNPQLTSIDSALFRSLMNLKEIRVSGNNIEDLNLEELLQLCPSLTDLDLSNNHLDNRLINSTSMRRGDQLHKLNLANNRLESMEFVFNLTSLTKLDLSGNQISTVVGNGINTLGRLMQLKELDLSGNQIESFEEEMIHHLRRPLERVNLRQNPFDTKHPDILKKIQWLPRSVDDTG